ncbi:hypothetical protein [Phytohabitans kaempferiae]|uniref:Threonine synthase n=1 Tax=Phytohabitans kaempferiae TaxID=1620943 RepID=A0ABV6M849_9ACTN
MTATYLLDLECPRCETRYDASRPRNLCACGSPLLARYDLAAARALRASGWLGEDEEAVVLNTGTGLKYPDNVET